jgi:hypothetical protein
MLLVHPTLSEEALRATVDAVKRVVEFASESTPADVGWAESARPTR